MNEDEKFSSIIVENQDVADMLDSYEQQAKTSSDNDKDEDGFKLRRFDSKAFKIFIAVYACLAVLYHVYAVVVRLSYPLQLYSIHWGIGLFLIYLYYPAYKGQKQKRTSGLPVPAYDLALAALVLLVTIYVNQDVEGFAYRLNGGVGALHSDIVIGVLAILLSIEAARRTIGWGLPVVALVFLAYCLWGDHLPPLIASRGYSLKRTVMYVFGSEGIFGAPIRMSSKYIFLLIVFGAFLGECGTGEYFIRLATKIAGSAKGGPAKVAVVASGLFGSISGSAVANVMGTGVFTIPLMKKAGYRYEFAAAVEAVASTGGQILPPVMGSGAFIMAELMGIRYSSVVLAALVPALLYYFAVFSMVDLEAGKNNLVGVDTSRLESTRSMLASGWNLLIPLLVLTIFIVFRSATVSRAAVYAILSAIVGCAIRKSTRMSLQQIINAMVAGTLRSLSVIAACACAGVAVGTILLSGIGTKFTFVLTELAGGNLFLTLIFSGLGATVLGMGLPTVAAYVIAASLLVSTLTSLGVPLIVAHLFLFYYSLLSQITPPVALASYAAATISGSNPNKVGFLSMRLGVVAFIIPFFFVYGTELVMIGRLGNIILAIITAFIGVYCLTIGFSGWFLDEDLSVLSRMLMFGAAFCMIMSGWVTDLIGFGQIGLFLLLHSGIRRRLRITHA